MVYIIVQHEVCRENPNETHPIPPNNLWANQARRVVFTIGGKRFNGKAYVSFYDVYRHIVHLKVKPVRLCVASPDRTGTKLFFILAYQHRKMLGKDQYLSDRIMERIVEHSRSCSWL